MPAADLAYPLSGEPITLLDRTRITGDDSGDAYTGFAAVSQLDLSMRVSDLIGPRGKTLTVIVEQSDDGETWDTAASNEFAQRGHFKATIDAPKDRLRVRWDGSAELDGAVVSFVEVFPRYAGIPAQWTLDPATGNTLIEALPPGAFGENGLGGILLRSTDDNNIFDLIMCQSQDGTTTLGVDPFGYISASGAALAPYSDVTVLQLDGHQNTFSDIFQARDAGGYKIRMTFDGRVLLPDLPTADPHVTGQLWNSSGALKVSAG